MGHSTCCVVNCHNNGKNSDCKFYVFPRVSYKQQQRNKWIVAVQKVNPTGENWYPKKYDYICSAHFIGNRKSEEELSPSYVPTIFFPNCEMKSKKIGEAALNRHKRYLKRRNLRAITTIKKKVHKSKKEIAMETPEQLHDVNNCDENKKRFQAQQEAAGIHVTIQEQGTSGPSFDIKEEITIDEPVLENVLIDPKLEPFETTSASTSNERDPLEEVDIHILRETVPQSTHREKLIVSPNTPVKSYNRKRKISDVDRAEDNDFLKTIKVKIENGDEHVDYGIYIANRLQNSNQSDRAIAMAKQKIELILSDLDTGIFENCFH